MGTQLLQCKSRCFPLALHVLCTRNVVTEDFFGLVVIAQVKHPVPSRTRQLSTVAPMVLRLKAWESRSLPNLKNPLFVRSSARTVCISLTMLPNSKKIRNALWRGMEQPGSSSGS
jgi:hypothetical protein